MNAIPAARGRPCAVGQRLAGRAFRSAEQQPQRTAAKSLVAKAVEIITGQAQGDAAAAVNKASSALDRAAKHGAIHKNAAARRKSRLAQQLKAKQAAAA